MAACRGVELGLVGGCCCAPPSPSASRRGAGGKQWGWGAGCVWGGGILLTRGAQAVYVQYREECAARHAVERLKAQFHADIANLLASPAVKALPEEQKREFVVAAVRGRAAQLAVQMQHAFQPPASAGDTLTSSAAAAQTWAADQEAQRADALADLPRLGPETPRPDQHLVEGSLDTAASSAGRRTPERRRETLSPTREFAAPPARKHQ